MLLLLGAGVLGLLVWLVAGGTGVGRIGDLARLGESVSEMWDRSAGRLMRGIGEGVRRLRP